MAFNASKTLMLEKQYLYVRASKGFQLVGTSTERIWTNTGYYRFLVENVAKSIGNSYVTIEYDNSDTDFIAYCSDLFLEEIQNSVTTAVENIESIIEDFSETNHEDIDTLSAGLSVAMNELVGDDGTQKNILASVSNVLKQKYMSLEVDSVIFCSSVSGINDYQVNLDNYVTDTTRAYLFSLSMSTSFGSGSPFTFAGFDVGGKRSYVIFDGVRFIKLNGDSGHYRSALFSSGNISVMVL